MLPALEPLLVQWREEKVPLLPGAAEWAIRSTFAKVGLHATSDVMELYSRVGGMAEMDRYDWRLWSLEEIEDRHRHNSGTGVLFSDYMIDCWGYRLYPGQNDMSAVYVDYVYDGSRKPIVVAPTLNAFFKAYLNDADGLLNQPHGR